MNTTKKVLTSDSRGLFRGGAKMGAGVRKNGLLASVGYLLALCAMIPSIVCQCFVAKAGLLRLCGGAVGVLGGRHGGRVVWLLPIILLVLTPLSASAATDPYATAGTFTWTAPAGVTSVTVECWGGGGGGGTRTTNGGGGGGGGGAYARSVVAVTPLAGYQVVVGAAGTPAVNAGNSSFNTTTVVAEGGKSVANNTATAGIGGLAANSTGTVRYNGGNGFTYVSGTIGGGGGSSAGTGANGNAATSNTGATAVTGGGPGGNGAAANANGSAPASGPGGGGGGAYRSSGTRTGGNGWGGQVLITYTLPVDTLSVTANTTIASSAAPLATDVQMQRLQVDCSNTGDSSCVISSITVDDLGTAGATDITNLKIHIDSDTDFGNGALGTVTQAGFNGSSTLVSLTALSAANRTVTFGTSKYIWITYDLASSADGKTIQSSVTNIAVDAPDNGVSGTWDANLFTVNSGPISTLADCASCHNYPPVDSASRNATTGDFIGDHDKHAINTCATCHVTPATESSTDFAHRTGKLSMDNGNIGVGADNGTYSKGTEFNQVNNPTGGTCSAVDCHSNSVTPQWGVGTTACNSCHALPPATGAHTAHYTAKGWATGVETNCTQCHPNNTAGHSDVSDASVIVTRSNTTYLAGSCSGTGIGLGCHNEYDTPIWASGNAVCSNCHVAGGVKAGDPTTGLHVTINLTDHDGTLTGGTGLACEKCHTASPSNLHFNGTVNNAGNATFAWNATNIPAGYDRTNDYCAATCHSDGGTWYREWSGVTDAVWAYGNDASTAPVCGNCHGSFATGWNIVGNTSHGNPDIDNDNNAATGDNPDTLATSKASHGECSKCHGWGHTNYTTGTKHKNNTLEMNSTLGYNNANPDATCTTNCHSGQALTMKSVSGWTDAAVVGVGVACGDCHNGGVTPVSATGAHAAHGATFASVAANPASIALCVNCHGNNGTGATHNNGSVSWATNLTYSQAASRGNLTGTCSGTAGCHVATTNIQWNQTQAGVNNCAVCHQSSADLDDINGTNNSASRIDGTDYTGTGHGKAGVAKGCMDCHTTAVAHNYSNPIAGTNPFRLVGYGSDVNSFCSNEAAGCHTVSTGMLNHNQTNAGAKYTWAWTPNCTDCHDPHGDGTTFNNLKMVQQNPTDGSSGAHGVGGTTEGTAVDFTTQADILAGSFAATDGKGICQVCHTQASATTGAFLDGDTTPINASSAHPTTGLNPCTSCHTHNTGFKASGCSGCHGGGTSGATAKNYWPDASTGHAANNTPGAHLTHMTKLASKVYNQTITQLLSDLTSPSDTKQKALCIYCHDANAGDHATALPNEVGPGKTSSGAADNMTYSGGSCSTSDCHNNKNTPVWTTTSSACTICHTSNNGTGIVDPSSGLHDPTPAPTVSGQAHNESLGTGCTGCHSNMATSYPTLQNSSTHINGVNDSGTMAHLSLAAGLNFNNTNNTCFGSGNTGFASCHVGNFDAGTWTRKWNNTISYQSNGTQCAGCHGGFNNDWTFGSADNTTDFAVSHARDWNTDSVANELIGKHADNVGNTTKCNICHVYNDAPYSTTWGTGNHGNNRITMNSTMGYSGATFGCTSNCHTEGGSHNLEASSSVAWATRGEAIAGPALSCTGCHGGGSPSAGVSSTSPHTKVGKAVGYNTFVNCTECHNGHANGTTGANDVEIATTQASFNAKYASHGSKIQLGGARTTGNTEAEICWNCHQNDTYQGAPDISEWDGTHATYDYGSVTSNTLNWLTTSWTSARPEFAYKNGKLTNKPTVASPVTGTTNGGSTHGVMGGAAGVDAIGAIGCSACHDVHDTGGGTNNGTGPYLRGTWQSNPYREDGAPRTGAGQTINSVYFGAVPRGTTVNNYGGYQIDQNNASPALTANSAAGLCELCHGNADGSWTTTELGAIGGSTAWISTGNSHAYVVKGGLTTGGFNLYKEGDRLPTTGFATSSSDGGRAGRPSMSYKHLTSTSLDGYGFRGTDGRSFVDTPAITGNSRPYGHGQYAWGATVDTTTTNGGYHQFTCSKCHNPHASRLPRLMITNCLDTKLNTWDDTLTVPAAGTGNGQGTDTVSTENGGVGYSNATSAQNCHRLKNPAFTNAGGNGWNSATPWQ